MTNVKTIFVLMIFVFYSAVSALDTGLPAKDKQGMEARLHGGNPVTDVNAYPYVVAVVSTYNGNIGVFGQAVAINRNFALTSGFVSNAIQGNEVSSSVFSNTLNVSSLSSGVRHRIEKSFPHPDYPATMFQYMNNVGLIKVCPGFTISRYAQLPAPGQQFAAGTPGEFVGWGMDLTQLMEVPVVLDNATDCNVTAVMNTYVRPFNETNDLCTVGQQYNFICENDDGVGQYVNDTIIGMASLGACNSYHLDIIYADTQTQVSVYVQWILDNSV